MKGHTCFWRVCLVLWLAGSSLVAQSNSEFRYQGKIQKDGKPIPNGQTVTLQFELHADSTGSNNYLWTNSLDVQPTNGVFSLLVGPVPDSLMATYEDLWLKVSVVNGSQSSDLAIENLASVPYAMHAGAASRLSAPNGGPFTALIVDDIGNIGVGVTKPGTKLDINGTLNFHRNPPQTLIQYSGDSLGQVAADAFKISYINDFWGGSDDALVFEKTDLNHNTPDGGIAFVNTGADAVMDTSVVIRGNSRVGIRTANPSVELEVDGNIKAENFLVEADLRLKSSTMPLSSVLDNLQYLSGIIYSSRILNVHNTQIGLIAQEVEEVFPELVHTDDRGFKSVNYGRFVPILIEAIKEQQSIIQSQNDEQAQLKREMNELRSKLEQVEQLLVSLQDVTGN